MSELDELFKYHEKHKQEMQESLERCRERGKSNDARELFEWLCKNLLASRAEWENASKAVQYLSESNLLYDGSPSSIESGLRLSGYRSQNNKKKAEWIFKARRLLWDGECGMGIVDVVEALGFKCVQNPINERNRLADTTRDNHIPGLGMKEASHFLRGLGFSHDKLAILDTQVLGVLPRFGVIVAADSHRSPDKRTYLAIEGKVATWADKVRIPLDGLDWLLWRMARNDWSAENGAPAG